MGLGREDQEWWDSLARVRRAREALDLDAMREALAAHTEVTERLYGPAPDRVP